MRWNRFILIELKEYIHILDNIGHPEIIENFILIELID